MIFGMRVTKAAGIQCWIVVLVLAVEIGYAGEYHAASHTVGQSSDMQAKDERGAEDDPAKGGAACASVEEEKEEKSAEVTWAEALAELSEKGCVYAKRDINFDGYLDVSIYNDEKKERRHFLWDEAGAQFVEAVIPEDIVEGYDIEKKLDDTKTFWGYNDIRNDEYEIQEMRERLYQWEGVTLREVRSISCQLGEEEIRIVLTDPKSGACPACGTFEKEGWEKNPEVRELYAQFYQGYAPKELYYMCHDAPGEEEVIPGSLVETLSEAFAAGAEFKLLESLESGRELSDEEEAEAVKSADIAQAVEDVGSGYVKMVKTDLDNDGVEDIFAEVDFGGTGGFGEYVLFQGDETGGYRRTGVGIEEHVRKEFYVICWEGKNYACHYKLNNGLYPMSGLILEGYRDGELVETVTLNLEAEKRNTSVVFCQDEYRDMAQKELEKAPLIYEQSGKYIEYAGDAEQEANPGEKKEKNVFISDLDNDGIMESYHKEVSDFHRLFFLAFWMEDEKMEQTVKEAISAGYDDSSQMIMLWVDRWGEENVINILYQAGLHDYAVAGFLLDNTGSHRNVYLIESKAKRSVREVRAWEVPGKRYRIP